MYIENTDNGLSNKEIKDFLCDGEALSGYTQEEVEDAYNDLKEGE